jgi:nucleotide-binding universal stress UspA family protein
MTPFCQAGALIMHAFHSMMLATDFRPASLDATQVAVDLAAAFGARATLFHVFQPVSLTANGREEEKTLVRWELEELVQQLTKKAVVVEEAEVVEGHPADRILRKAHAIEADLVLIGAGKWTRDPFAPGPIAEVVLQHCRRSVLAVRPGPPSVRFRRILCPVDQSPSAERALQTAIRVARLFEGSVHVVTVVPEVGRLSAQSLADHKQRWRQKFEEFLGRADFNGIAWQHEIRHGVPHAEIVASAREHFADVIIMGSTGRTGLARLLMGSVARRVLQDLPCSLWSVKQEELVEQQFEEDLRYVRLLLAEGRSFLEAKDGRHALLKFRQVLACDPFNSDALEGQAEAFEQLGQRDRAEVCRHRAEKVRQRAPAGEAEPVPADEVPCAESAQACPLPPT